jgi:DNA-binding response OmpR family regulator
MATKARILVVEDDSGIRALLADRLTHYELVFVTCQRDCYTQLQSPDFDLILLDLKLPRTPTEMTPNNQVGIDILCQIRKRQLTRRASAMPMPVVVMTAHGSERVSISVLVDHGASDYIPKPFGEGLELEQKIERALAGTAALVPRQGSMATVQVSFHPRQQRVKIETLEYRGATHGLLRALREQHVRDREAELPLDEYGGILGDALADLLGISDKAVRQRIANFRKQVEQDFRASLGRALDKQDIIQNMRGWDGYRLNPFVVRVVRWTGGE